MTDLTSNCQNNPKVGILAFQGAYDAHGKILTCLGAEIRRIKTADDFDEISHLVIPGGETTTFLKLLEFNDLTEPIINHVKSGKPILVTCAGLILIASRVTNPEQSSLGLLDVTVERNSYGSQVNSFVTDVNIPVIGDKPFEGIFIRAPRIESCGSDVSVLGKINGDPVVVRQNNILAATFHPELSDDTRLHEFFLSLG